MAATAPRASSIGCTYRPRIAPGYTDPNLDPYAEPVGRDETDDPLHFGSSLIERIAERGEHEIASHTWSHYYCMEPGATPAAFAEAGII